MIDDGDCGAIGGIKIGRGNRSTRRKPAPAPLCPPQIPHDQTRARTRAAAVGSQRLTAWAMARPQNVPFCKMIVSASAAYYTDSFTFTLTPRPPSQATASKHSNALTKRASGLSNVMPFLPRHSAFAHISTSLPLPQASNIMYGARVTTFLSCKYSDISNE
jgi:hypothetical protein